MKSLATVVLIAALISSMGCGTILQCQSTWDTATCRVNQAIAMAQEIDHLASIAAVIPALAEGYAIYHAALPLAIKTAQDALAVYEAGGSSDWEMAVNFLVALYNDVEAWFVGHGVKSLVAQAKVIVAQPGYTCKAWKPAGVKR